MWIRALIQTKVSLFKMENLKKNTIMSKSIFKTLFGYWSINSHFNGHTDLEKLSSTLSDMNGLYR